MMGERQEISVLVTKVPESDLFITIPTIYGKSMLSEANL